MAFNLADVLGNVSNLGTDREQIEYIDIDLIDDDPNNFYELSELDELAGNIELLGLQQPLRVRPNPEDPNRVIIVSGHRRRAAIRKLVEDGKDSFREIACIREQSDESAAMQELRLIFANSNTRKMSSAEQGKQAQRVEELLYQLKEEGVEFPGRMRDHVAQACQMSKSKLARLKVIRENLIPYFMKRYEKDKLKESVAYELARLPEAHQKYLSTHQDALSTEMKWWTADTVETYGKRMANIDKLKCKEGVACSNSERKYVAALNEPTWYSTISCTKCCSKCEKLVSCKYACPKLAEQVKKLKADAKAQREQQRIAREERDAPDVAQVREIWNRFARARHAAGVTVQEYFKATDRYFDGSYRKKFEELELPDARLKPDSELPYIGLYLWNIRRLVKTADLLDCSLDYLFGRTDVPKLDTREAPVEGWLPLEWLDGREKPHKWGQTAVVKHDVEGLVLRRLAYWDGVRWKYRADGPVLDGTVVAWFPIPEDN